MTDVSAESLVEQLRQSVEALLRWAEAYQPRTLHERAQYDADLDAAEALLDSIDAWLVLHADRS